MYMTTPIQTNLIKKKRKKTTANTQYVAPCVVIWSSVPGKTYFGNKVVPDQSRLTEARWSGSSLSLAGYHDTVT